jgi:esterase/lipase superfamily enzyme
MRVRRRAIEKIVVQFLAARFSQPRSTVQNNLQLSAVCSMNKADLRDMISELAAHISVRLKLSGQASEEFSKRVQRYLGDIQTLGELVSLIWLSLDDVFQTSKPTSPQRRLKPLKPEYRRGWYELFMRRAEREMYAEHDPSKIRQYLKKRDQAIRNLEKNLNTLPPVGRVSSKLRKTALPAVPQVVKTEYVVWYGTNRRPHKVSGVTKGYSAERDSKVHYGSCRVYIPESHKIGSLGSSWLKRVWTWTDDRLKLRVIKETSSTSFWQQIAFRLSRLGVAERHAVIFVHGYNVSFNDAALRAAQIGFDLSIKGAMAFFSWPSQGTLGGYMADTATIEASEQDITNFLIDFVTRSGAEAVHIIAHSMGNRGVLRAVNRIAERAQERSHVPFGQIILAAADVDSDTFRQLCGAYARIARRTTLYVSDRDRAVEASHWLHHFPRVGLMPPVYVARGIDTIGVTNVDLTLLGHGYIGDAREVLTDIHQLITTGAPPNQRFGLTEAMTSIGERYWVIRG